MCFCLLGVVFDPIGGEILDSIVRLTGSQLIGLRLMSGTSVRTDQLAFSPIASEHVLRTFACREQKKR
jgi:hypothetical protein